MVLLAKIQKTTILFLIGPLLNQTRYALNRIDYNEWDILKGDNKKNVENI